MHLHKWSGSVPLPSPMSPHNFTCKPWKTIEFESKSSQPPVSQGVPKEVQNTRYATLLEPPRQGQVVEWLPIVWSHFFTQISACISESMGQSAKPGSTKRSACTVGYHVRLQTDTTKTWTWHKITEDNCFAVSCEITSRKMIQDCHKL